MKRFVKPFGLFLLAGLFTLSVFAGSDDEASYVGSKRCKVCHMKQYKSWATTKMASVINLLKPGERVEAKLKAKLDPKKDYTHDTKCLPCHTTGYGKPGGFRSIEETPNMAGVQCEACHGAHSKVLKVMTIRNKNYKRQDVLAAGLIIPDKNTCVSLCHNSKSPLVPPGSQFDFETRKKKGTHVHIPLKFNHGS